MAVVLIMFHGDALNAMLLHTLADVGHVHMHNWPKSQSAQFDEREILLLRQEQVQNSGGLQPRILFANFA